jgi:hypothetical protein
MKMTPIWRFLLAILLAVVVGLFLTSSALASGFSIAGIGGNDISYPQCKVTSYPLSAAFGVVGVTGGRAFRYNSCLAREFAWAAELSMPPSLYMNLNAPIGPTASKGMTGPYGSCAKKNMACQAANYGYNAAQYAFNYAQQQGAGATMWWLDIETANSWFSNTSLNRLTIDGAVKFFANHGLTIGTYSTPHMWKLITENYRNRLPVWAATTSTSPSFYCLSSFTGGPVYLVQYSNPATSFDSDYTCL